MIVLIDYGDKEYYVRAKCLYLYLYYLQSPILSYLNYIIQIFSYLAYFQPKNIVND